MLKSASTDNIGSEDPKLDSVLVCVSLSEKLRFGFDPDVDAWMYGAPMKGQLLQEKAKNLLLQSSWNATELR